MSINTYKNISDLIIEIRGEKVILDSDVAEIYGIETKRVNEAVKNNPDKFPEGYIIRLEDSEWNRLKSKFSTSKKGGKVKLPNVFSEKGLYMLATVLKSGKATEATIAIIETFAKLRTLSRTMSELAIVKDQDKQKSLMSRSGELLNRRGIVV